MLISQAMNDLLEHIHTGCKHIAVQSISAILSNPDKTLKPSEILNFGILQGYLNGVLDASRCYDKLSSNDRDNYIDRLRLLLIPVRLELEATLKRKQEEDSKESDSRN